MAPRAGYAGVRLQLDEMIDKAVAEQLETFIQGGAHYPSFVHWLS